MSTKKEQAIYDAVSEAVLKLRIKRARVTVIETLDFDLAQLQDAAGLAAIAAYRKPLRPTRRTG